MLRTRGRMPFLRTRIPAPATSVIDFYREEFVKHQECLAAQREYFSDAAIGSVEAALGRIIAEIDALTHADDADVVVSRLLKEFDVVTRLSAWTDPLKIN